MRSRGGFFLESAEAPPAELVGVLEAVGQSWMAEERFSLLEDDDGEGGIFVIRTW